MRQIAIVLAAGRGKRMQSAVAKQYLLLKDKPVLYYALKQFEEGFVDDIILVTAEEEIAYCREHIVEAYGFQKVRCVVAGGKERYHSVYQGLLAAGKLCSVVDAGSSPAADEVQNAGSSSAADEVRDMGAVEHGAMDACIYIHDGARPFIQEEILERARKSVEQYGSGVVGMPVKDTVKLVDEEGFVTHTPKRSLVWQIQTPQCFLYSVIMPAYTRLIQEEDKILAEGVSITDDAMVAELFTNQKVKLVEGSYENIKLTTPEDLTIAEGFLKKFQAIS